MAAGVMSHGDTHSASKPFPIIGRAIQFEEAAAPLVAELVEVDGSGVRILNSRGDGNRPLEEPKFWFHPPGEIGPPEWQFCRGPGVGIANSGNSCFVNAALQALCYCPPLAQDYLRRRHSRSCERKAAKVDCICCAFEQFVNRLFGQKGPYNPRKDRLVPPASLRKFLGKEPHMMFAQQDTHEALTTLLEKLRRCDLPMACERDFERHGIPNAELSTSYWNQLMIGFLEERRTCLTCHRGASAFHPFWDLILSVGNRTTFEGALAKYFESEFLRNGNEVWCDFCGMKQPKLVERRIHRPPNVLTVVFQRVCHKNNGMKKLERDICIPSEIDISPFTRNILSGTPGESCRSAALHSKKSTSDEQHMKKSSHHSSSSQLDLEHRADVERNRREFPPSSQLLLRGRNSEGSDKTQSNDNESSDNRYHFFSAIAHTGSAMFGHYFAYCRAPDNRIYAIDDEYVSLANVVRGSYICVPYSSVYLCIYARVNPAQRPPPSEVTLYSSLVSPASETTASTAETTGSTAEAKSGSYGEGLDITAALKAAAMAGRSAEVEGVTARIIVKPKCDTSSTGSHASVEVLAKRGQSCLTSKKGKAVKFNESSELRDACSPYVGGDVNCMGSPLPLPSKIVAAREQTSNAGVVAGVSRETCDSVKEGKTKGRGKKTDFGVSSTSREGDISWHEGLSCASTDSSLRDVQDGDGNLSLRNGGKEANVKRRDGTCHSQDICPVVPLLEGLHRPKVACDERWMAVGEVFLPLPETPPQLPETPPHRAEANEESMTPQKLQSMRPRQRQLFDPGQRQRSALSLMNQFGANTVQSWDDEGWEDLNENSLPFSRMCLPPQRRSMAFTEAQSALQPQPLKRSEHDREYDRGKLKKVKKRLECYDLLPPISCNPSVRENCFPSSSAGVAVNDATQGNAAECLPRISRTASSCFDKAAQKTERPVVFFRGRKKRTRQMQELAQQQKRRRRRKSDGTPA